MNRVCAGGGFVLNIAGELLMIFRNGRWDLPKGKLESGETIEDCAVREVCEECGLAVGDLELGEFLVETIHYYDDFRLGRVEKSVVWFSMRYHGGSNVLQGQAEEGIERAEWVPLDRAAELVEGSYDTIRKVFAAARA